MCFFVQIEISGILLPVLTVAYIFMIFLCKFKIFVLLRRIIQYLLHTPQKYFFSYRTQVHLYNTSFHTISCPHDFYNFLIFTSISFILLSPINPTNYSVSCSNNPYSIRISDNFPLFNSYYFTRVCIYFIPYLRYSTELTYKSILSTLQTINNILYFLPFY